MAILVACGSVQGQLLTTGPTQKLATVASDGKMEVLEGFVDLRAIKVVGGLDAETMDRVTKFAREWMLDVQQQVIDNVDFIVEIEPLDGSEGYFSKIDLQDAKTYEKAARYALQLNSAGTLLNSLLTRRVLNSQQAQVFQREVYNYDMVLLRQVTDGGKDAKVSTRHQYQVAFRDALGMYHSLLDRGATCVDAAVAGLGAETAANLKAAVEAVKGAKGKEETRAAMRALLQKLPMVQRRTLLMKVRDLVPITDPLAMV